MAKAFPKTWERKIKQDGRWPVWVMYLFDKDSEPLTEGFQMKCQVKKTAASTTVEKEFTIGSGLVQAGNKITWEGIADLPVRSYVVDIEVTDSNNVPEYSSTAVITIEPNITD